MAAEVVVVVEEERRRRRRRRRRGVGGGSRRRREERGKAVVGLQGVGLSGAVEEVVGRRRTVAGWNTPVREAVGSVGGKELPP